MIRFKVGDNFEGDNWTGNAKKVTSLKLYLKKVKDDLSEQISEEAGDSI